MKKPECHRHLWLSTENEGIITRTERETFTPQDLYEYYAISFGNPPAYTGSYVTREFLDQAKKTAIEECPELSEKEEEKLLDMVDKFGLEVVLYAIDLTLPEKQYPAMDEILPNIPDAEVTLAGLIRTRDSV